MTDALVDALAKRLIARPDVKAIQRPDGAYMPVRERTSDGTQGANIPWARADLEAHIAGRQTFGHYVVNTASQTKLFCFDIDLTKSGWLPTQALDGLDMLGAQADPQPVDDLRAAWHDRAHPARRWMKIQFRDMAGMLAKATKDMLGIDVAVAYSGNKGLHVYGLTGLVDAAFAREGAMVVLDHLGCFTPERGNVFFKHTNSDPLDGYPNLSIEVFPKQDSLAGKDLGNLIRLPLGRNQKAPDPTFFVDMAAASDQLVAVDPLRALTPGYNLWMSAGEFAAAS